VYSSALAFTEEAVFFYRIDHRHSRIGGDGKKAYMVTVAANAAEPI
jgi:hypothetical protein